MSFRRSYVQVSSAGAFSMLPPAARIIVDSMELNYSTSENATSLYSQPVCQAIFMIRLIFYAGYRFSSAGQFNAA